MEKVQGLFSRMAEAAVNGRVHPVWTLNPKTGTLQCRNPNICNIPHTLFEVTGGLDGYVRSLEVFVAARMVGESELAEALADEENAERHLADFLREGEAAEFNRNEFKLCFFHSFYGTEVEGETQAEIRRYLQKRFPNLFAERAKEDQKRLTCRARRGVSEILLEAAEKIDRFPGCQVVGFLHGEVLVEYAGPESEKGKFEGLVRDTVRSTALAAQVGSFP